MYQIGPFVESGRVNRSWNPYAPRSTDDCCPYHVKSGCYGLEGVGQAPATPSSTTVLWVLGAVVAAGLAVGGLDALTRKAGR